MEMNTAESLLHGPNPFEIEIAIKKLKRYKLPNTDQILAELIQAGSKTIGLGFKSTLISFGIRKNCHSSGRYLLSYPYVFMKRIINLTVVIIERPRCSWGDN
jgi:hypothetical protein